MQTKSVSVVGLGKLGLPIAACFASKGFEVVGIDINSQLVDSIANNHIPFFEPGLNQMISKNRRRMTFATDFSKAIKDTDITFIIVPTPSKKNGEFSSKFLESALAKLASELKNKNKHHLFVINSTVMPGTVDRVLIPLVSSISGKKMGIDFDVCYNPEFIALGNVIANLQNPDIILIGESSEKAGKTLSGIYQKFVNNKPSVERMSIVSAEIMKISLNVYVTMKISFANQLSQICQAVEGSNIDHITKALGGDKRIGSRYLQAGTSYGGPCFPRDNRAFSKFAKGLGQTTLLSLATDKINHQQDTSLLSIVKHHTQGTKKILILGAAYKDNTGVTEESAAIKLIHSLIKDGTEVSIYDELAKENLKNEFGEQITILDTLNSKTLDSASVCVITLPGIKYKKKIENHHFIRKTTIIDCWRTIDPTKLKGKTSYVPVGIPPSKAS